MGEILSQVWEWFTHEIKEKGGKAVMGEEEG